MVAVHRMLHADSRGSQTTYSWKKELVTTAINGIPIGEIGLSLPRSKDASQRGDAVRRMLNAYTTV
jgi:hypothetical protein